MPIVNGPIDNRWRPDLEASQRRIRDEELEDLPEKVVYSRELSFVPVRRKAFEPHDAQTRALIRRHKELERLPPHGEKVSVWAVELLDRLGRAFARFASMRVSELAPTRAGA